MRYQQLGVLDDTEKLAPLPEAPLPQQEGADLGVLHQVHGGLLGRPLVPRLLALSVLLLLVIRLVGAAHRVRVVICQSEESDQGKAPAYKSLIWKLPLLWAPEHVRRASKRGRGSGFRAPRKGQLVKTGGKNQQDSRWKRRKSFQLKGLRILHP